MFQLETILQSGLNLILTGFNFLGTLFTELFKLLGVAVIVLIVCAGCTGNANYAVKNGKAVGPFEISFGTAVKIGYPGGSHDYEGDLTANVNTDRLTDEAPAPEQPTEAPAPEQPTETPIE